LGEPVKIVLRTLLDLEGDQFRDFVRVYVLESPGECRDMFRSGFHDQDRFGFGLDGSLPPVSTVGSGDNVDASDKVEA
jgi:hypothetical protein